MVILGVVDSGVVAALISSVALVSLVDAIASGGWGDGRKEIRTRLAFRPGTRRSWE